MNSIDLSLLTGVQKTTAELLADEFGQCQFLHYGLHSEAPESANYQEQQRLFAEKIFRLSKADNDAIEESHSRDKLLVLLDGISFSYLAQKIEDKGHKVKWLDQRKSAADLSETSNPALLEAGIDSEGSDEKFDLIIIEGSYHYLQQMPMLSKARELLSSKGQLIVISEYLNDDSEIERSPLPNLSSMRQLAERLSYSILDELNFTADAIASIDAIKTLAESRSAEVATDLTANLAASASEFLSNRRCYKIFRLQKNRNLSGEYALAEYGDIGSFDPQEILLLFEKSFDTTFNQDIWNWKYELGQGKCVVARGSKNGEIVSHYGGAPRQIQYFGKPNTAIQVCDVMVLPEIRRQYGKSSLFFKTAATFLEREIGNTVNHLLGFGFPNQKAMNIAFRLGLYEKTDEYLELVYPLRENLETSSFQLVPIEIYNTQHQQCIDQLWLLMKQETTAGIIGDRHWRYIKYRYFDHPLFQSNQYRCVFLNDEAGESMAAVFLKEHEERLLVLDLLCPPSAMKHVLGNLAQLLSEKELKIWITRGWVDAVKTESAIENNLGIEIPCNSWNPGPHSDDLYGAWWLTAGDMDFM